MIIKLTEIDFHNEYENPNSYKIVSVKVEKEPVYVNTNAIFSFRKCEHQQKLYNGDVFARSYTEINLGEGTSIEVNENPEEIMQTINAQEAK